MVGIVVDLMLTLPIVVSVNAVMIVDVMQQVQVFIFFKRVSNHRNVKESMAQLLYIAKGKTSYKSNKIDQMIFGLTTSTETATTIISLFKRLYQRPL